MRVATRIGMERRGLAMKNLFSGATSCAPPVAIPRTFSILQIQASVCAFKLLNMNYIQLVKPRANTKR